MKIKFDIWATLSTATISFLVLFLGVHISGYRNSQFGFLHEVIDLFGNMSKSLVTGEKDFDWGEWEPVNGEAQPTQLTPEQIQQYVDQQLER